MTKIFKRDDFSKRAREKSAWRLSLGLFLVGGNLFRVDFGFYSFKGPKGFDLALILNAVTALMYVFGMWLINSGFNYKKNGPS